MFQVVSGSVEDGLNHKLLLSSGLVGQEPLKEKAPLPMSALQVREETPKLKKALAPPKYTAVHGIATKTKKNKPDMSRANLETSQTRHSKHYLSSPSQPPGSPNPSLLRIPYSSPKNEVQWSLNLNRLEPPRPYNPKP